MDCEIVRDNLSSFHDDELPAELASEVRQHLSCCSDCALELQNFDQLGDLVSKAYATDILAVNTTAARYDAEGLWRRIQSRLDSQPSNNSRLSKAITASASIPRGQFVLGAFVAMAASLLLVVGWWTRPAAHESNPLLATAVIDFAEVLKQFDGAPNRAIESFAARFPFTKVSNDLAEAALGFRPAVNGELPQGMRLASTAIAKMPSCNCAEGQCMCGPGGCNCAASVCQRKDGSMFLVFEHCKTQEISFGDLPSKFAVRDDHELQLIETSHQLAVSWIADNRRLTAVGLRGMNEAETLVAKISKPQSFN